ncbi:DinB family protein [Cohnella suwonensis]|uniref:DinB family protein n=1 Tax=Cohnella suwonensis TaxID=696072 RepID=A0ABW0M2M8_9BACL
MKKREWLLNGWDTAYDKEEWYPPLADALRDVTAKQASWRPDGNHVNTIWETLHHLVFYKERLLKRLTGEEKEYPEGVTNDDTFAVASATEKDWQLALSQLSEVHLGLREKLAGMTEDELVTKIPHREVGVWLQQLIVHDAYHAGQIIFLRKLQGIWPERRSFE